MNHRMQKERTEISYEVANSFMLRAPLMSVEILDEITACNDIVSLLHKYYSKEIVWEALFLSSPDLYEMLLSWQKGIEPSSEKKFVFTLLKYLIRMSSRCTPFGLFAGVCSGRFGDDTRVKISEPQMHALHVRPDMQFLCSLSDLLSKDTPVRTKLKYYPNTSLYDFANTYRYIEFFTDTEGIRKYRLQSTAKTPELKKILQQSISGVFLSELRDDLKKAGHTEDDAISYLTKLVDNQVLVGELEPNVSGEGYFNRLFETLHSREIQHDLRELLREFERNIKQALKQGAKRISCYQNLFDLVTGARISFKKSTLIQADMRLGNDACMLAESYKHQINNVLPILMKLTRPKSQDNLLDKFKENFSRRYEMQEIPLNLALDAEAGPGYLPDDTMANASALLEGLQLPPKEQKEQKLNWSSIDNMLYRKLQEVLMAGETMLNLSDADLSGLSIHKDGFPLSFSMMCKIPDSEKIQIISAGGSSALNLSGRFCYLDDGLHKAMREIADIEQELAGELILAEIIHLPQQRTGNILMRPVLRDFEIPFLGQSAVEEEFRIPVSDLMVSVRNDKVMLRSKRLNKYILPRLSNAHNYSMGSLSIYQFLCDLQTQDVRSSLGFSWGPLEDENRFLPRVCCKNFILSPANWRLFDEDIKALRSKKDDASLMAFIKEFREKYKVPSKVLLSRSDNELWLDLNNTVCLRLLQYELRNQSQAVLQEYLFDHKEAVVQGKEGPLNNEFVFFIHQQ